MSLSQGQVINNRYRIVKLLGQGGFGAVYRAWDVTLDRPCAVKESFELSPEGQRQFLREARILARLSHANLPRVTDYFTLPGLGQFLVMDYVEGQDLEELRAQAGGRLSEKLVLPWMAQVCEALEYLHSQQPAVIHRDIKPANIKITPPDKNNPQGRAMLVDFGVAKVYDPAMRTTMGARAVTPGFSPHEQYGQGTTDARSDIYALGATLYSLLTGQDPPESVQRVVKDPLAPPRRLASAISPAVEAVILKAMTMDPGRRFQSAAEFSARISNQIAVISGQSSASSSQLSVGSGQAARGAGQAAVKAARPAASPPLARRAAAPPPSPLSPAPLSPATLGVPLPQAKRPFPLKRLWLGLGVLVGVLVLAGLIGLGVKVSGDYRARQTAQAIASEIQDVNSSLAPMVLIPGGSFLMGAEYGYLTEMPIHRVTLDAFWMDQTEVTMGMYAQCVVAGACDPPEEFLNISWGNFEVAPEAMNDPVTYVDWYQAEAFCAWAGRRLPTEAEWEYAARGGLEGANYPWGNEKPSCTPEALNGAQYNQCLPGNAIEVGSFAPNGYGLYDMAGNAAEWVADWYGPYAEAAVESPSGPDSGDYKVLRTGSWDSDWESIRVASRNGLAPESNGYSLGFRCARTADEGDLSALTPLPPTLTPGPSPLPPSPTAVTPTKAPVPSITSLPSATTVLPIGTDVPVPCDRVSFVSDITIADNTEIPVGTTFVKTWRLRNNGTCTWTSDYTLVFYSGDTMNGPATSQLTSSTVPPGATIDVSVTLIAPTTPGTYRSEWRLRNADGATFGTGELADLSFWVQIRSVTALASTQVSPVDGMVMSYIPSGTFTMGSESGDDDEQPVHSVTLDAFWMDQTEVTNGMYAQCVADGDCSPPSNMSSSSRSSYYGEAAYADYPVIWVEWNQAAAYCSWAGRRLPTEAQWEYAARGGLVGAIYPWGNGAPSCGAWNGAQYGDCSPDDTLQVSSFTANGYGLYDMAGNVWEWVADWYGTYSSAAVENPSGPSSGPSGVLRSGSWYHDIVDMRVSNRELYFRNLSYFTVGFRCALSP